MGDDSDARRLRKEVARLETYIEEQRRRHTSDIKALRQDLTNECRYSERLRKELDDEFKHCERLRKELDGKCRLADDLREDLEDERHYSEKLERKLDKKKRQIEKLEAELLDLEDDYALAYKELKRMDSLRRELEDAKLLRLYAKQRISQLQEVVRTLRGKSRSPSPRRAPLSREPSSHDFSSHAFSSHAFSPLPPSSHTPSSQPPSSHAPSSRAPSSARAPTPRAVTPETASDYSDDDEDEQLSEKGDEEEEDEDEDEEVGDSEEPAVLGDEEAKQADDAPGQKLRNSAAREGRLADREFQRAREAFASGDKAFAKQLKDTGMQHRNDMKNYHRMAAAEIFNHHNPEYHSNPNARVKMDLHHLHVSEAKEFVEKHLELCRAGGIRRTEIICGRGNHSAGGVAKLRPAINEYLATQRDVAVDAHETNPGRIVVRFADSWTPEDDDIQLRSATKAKSRPEHADIVDVFEQGRTRLKAATKAATEMRQELEEIEQGVSAMKIQSETRRGLREATNRARADE